MKRVLRRHPTRLLLLLDTAHRAQTLLWDWRHSLSWGLRGRGLGSTRRWGARCRGGVVPRRWKSHVGSHRRSSGGLPHSLHAGHPPPQHLGLLQPVLQLLLSQLLLDVQTERNGTLVLLTVFGVVAAQGNELLADGAAAVCFALAALRVLNDALHLLAGRQRAVGVATLTRVHERLDAALDAEAAGVSGALGGCGGLVVAVVIQSKSQFVHLVHVAFSIVASDAQVIVLERKKKRVRKMDFIINRSITMCFGLCPHLTDSTVVTGFHVVFTFIAGVDEAVLALTVELHQHAHGAPLGPPEGAKLQVFVPAQRQEGIAAIHQVAGHQRVLVSDGGQRIGGGTSNEADNEEDLEVQGRGSNAC